VLAFISSRMLLKTVDYRVAKLWTNCIFEILHAIKVGKPVLHVYDARKERVSNSDSVRLKVHALTDFLRSNKIEVLNVAGPREWKGARQVSFVPATVTRSKLKITVPSFPRCSSWFARGMSSPRRNDRSRDRLTFLQEIDVS
jgi:hypothetical protein